ncbi:bifunctional diguanylate cyclase/phosphodiesterase [Jeotgalibacillus sp. R-1-5s-1]|uniref:sensor domain-containing protein n=1 Tax=Jeotgalibacillus sp. R-1-5s-1 TaxID=2555897 RepID=UPI00106AC925|nr:diguanylate cyclase [Jeotgalibacillus sp. R-1-5s-1]TFE00012.1 diguanylate cyclase [Jeotgalibacillus sp. R-1-5s-1]
MKQHYESNLYPFITMMNRISDIVFILEVADGPDFRYEFANEKAKERLEIDETILGRRFEDIYSDKRAEYLRHHYLELLRTNEPVVFEISTEDGWTGETTLNPITDENGHIHHILSITRDVTERKQLEASLLRKSIELGMVWDHASDAIFLMNEDGSIYKVNQAFEKMLGYTEAEVKNVLVAPFFNGHDQTKHEAFLARLHGGESFENMERQRVCKDGRMIEVLASYRPIKMSGRSYAIVMYKDISGMKAIERQLKEREERFRSLFDLNPDVIWATDQTGKIIDVNASVSHILGYSKEEVLNNDGHLLMGTEESQRTLYQSYMERTLQGESIEYKATVPHKKGRQVDLKIKTIPIKVNNEIIGMYEVGQDITKQNRAENALKKMAFSDSLTALPNRRYITEKIDETIQDAHRNGKMFALMYIDMDHFKEINDSMGHDVGDELLKQFSIRLQSALDDNQVVARIGGDEFLILIPDIENEKEVEVLAEKIFSSIKHEWKVDQYHFCTTSSMGISIYPTHGRNKRELIKQADEALYEAKNNGKNSYRIYQK